MNKKRIEENIPLAYEAIINSEIAENNKVKKAYRGQISTFGAAIAMGSLRSAVCYFKKPAEGVAGVDRSKLLTAIKQVLDTHGATKGNYVYQKTLEGCLSTDYAKNMVLKEDIINAAIAIKLAMNLFELED